MKNKLKVLYIVESIVTIITILLLFTLNSVSQEEVGIPTKYIFIPFVTYFIIFGSLIFEYVIGKRPYIRTAIIVLGILTALFCLGDSVELSAAALIIFALPYAVSMLIVWIKKDGVVTTTIRPVTTKTLPEGIYDKKDMTITTIFFIIYMIVVITVVIILEIANINPLYAFLSVPFAVIGLFIVSSNNALKKILDTVNKDLDFDKFNELTDNALKKNIHPESYNNLLIIKANYMFSYDETEGIKIFEETHVPTNKRFKNFYDIVEIEYLIRTKKYEEALEKINQLNSIQKPSIQNFYKVMATNEEMYNIEALYPETNKINYLNASSIYLKMHYYDTRNNNEEALKYAKRMIEYAPKLKEYVLEANSIIDKYN